MGLRDFVKRSLGGLALVVDALRLPDATAGQVLTAVDDGEGGVEFVAADAGGGGGMSNPMIGSADLIVGGSMGAPARLAKGSALQELRMDLSGNSIEWADGPYSVNVPLSNGLGWEVVAGTDGQIGTSAITFQGGGVARISGPTTGEVHDLTGPRLERPLPRAYNANRALRVSCRITARSAGTTGNLYGVLYMRDGATGGAYTNLSGVIFMSGSNDAISDLWVNGVASAVNNAVRPRMVIADFGYLYMGAIVTNGSFRISKSEVQRYTPTYVGLAVCSDVTSDGWVEVTDFTIEQT